MKSPRELAGELTQIVAAACDCGDAPMIEWRATPVTAHEYALIIGAAKTLLYDEREAAISEELKPTPEELATWEQVGEA